MTDFKRHIPNETHIKLRDGLAEVVLRHTNQDDIALAPVELMAVIGDLVGGVIAIQSQVTFDQAVEVLMANVDNGFNGTMERIIQSRSGAIGPQTGEPQ